MMVENKSFGNFGTGCSGSSGLTGVEVETVVEFGVGVDFDDLAYFENLVDSDYSACTVCTFPSGYRSSCFHPVPFVFDYLFLSLMVSLLSASLSSSPRRLGPHFDSSGRVE